MEQIPHSVARRRLRGALGRAAPWVCLTLLGLGGCASPAAPTVDGAVLAQRAYARNEAIRSVSDALDQRVDLMLAARSAGVPR